MPFLRFSRDKRGYANTYLCHTFRQDGIVRMRVLYWFRTPPDIEIGRPALDADAIRDIERSNPDLSFDWDEILKAKPLPAAQDRADGELRERRSRRRGRGASSGGGAPGDSGAAREPAPRQAASSPAASDAPSTESGNLKEERPAAPEGGAEAAPRTPPARRRRRRRRRGRGNGDERPAAPEAAAGAPEEPPPAGPDSDRT